MNKFNPGDRVVINSKCSISEWRGEKATVVSTRPAPGGGSIVDLDLDHPLDGAGPFALMDYKLDLIEPADALDALREVVSDLRAQGMTVRVEVDQPVVNTVTI